MSPATMAGHLKGGMTIVRNVVIGLIACCYWLVWVIYPHATMADVEWRTIKEIDLEAEPLDIFLAPEGQMLFILTRGEILIYSVMQQNITDRVPVDKGFDRITYSSQTNTLTLTSSINKSLQFLSLKFIQKFDISGLPFKGPEDAAVTFVVFSDYQCPYCSRLEPVLEQVLEKYPREVKLVIKHYPLPSHRFAEKAAVAALAANKQGKFWEFHHKLFKNQANLNDAKMQEIAKELGLNIDQFNQDLNDRRLKSHVERDISQARQADIRGVPALFVNGKLLTKSSFQDIQQAVENGMSNKK